MRADTGDVSKIIRVKMFIASQEPGRRQLIFVAQFRGTDAGEGGGQGFILADTAAGDEPAASGRIIAAMSKQNIIIIPPDEQVYRNQWRVPDDIDKAFPVEYIH